MPCFQIDCSRCLQRLNDGTRQLPQFAFQRSEKCLIEIVQDHIGCIDADQTGEETRC